MKLLHELSKMEDIYERLARAIAPSIYENEDIKKGILLQLFGGTKKSFTSSGRGNFRYLFVLVLCHFVLYLITPRKYERHFYFGLWMRGNENYVAIPFLPMEFKEQSP